MYILQYTYNTICIHIEYNIYIYNIQYVYIYPTFYNHHFAPRSHLFCLSFLCAAPNVPRFAWLYDGMAVDYEEGLRHLAAMEISPRNDGISPRIVGIFWDLHSDLTAKKTVI